MSNSRDHRNEEKLIDELAYYKHNLTNTIEEQTKLRRRLTSEITLKKQHIEEKKELKRQLEQLKSETSEEKTNLQQQMEQIANQNAELLGQYEQYAKALKEAYEQIKNLTQALEESKAS